MPILSETNQAAGYGLAVNLDPRSTLAGERGEEDFASGKSPWEDEDTRRFYEDVVDLQDLVPATLLVSATTKKGTSLETTGNHQPTQNEANEAATPAESSSNALPATASPTLSASSLQHDEQAVADEGLSAGPAAQLSALLARLPDMTNRALIDSACVDFAYLNSKAARKRLIKQLTALPRNRSDLIPYYARLIATLNPFFSEIGKGVIDSLDEEFRYLQHKRTSDLADNRTKNARYLGELTKFKVTPLHTTFHCLKVCLDDFSGHNIDVLAILLETCGRFLLRTESTSERTRALLEMLQRKRNAQNLDHRQIMLLDNAYYQCNPPERKVVQAKERSPMDLFIRHLIYDQLSRRSYEHVLKLLRKLPWSDGEVLSSLGKVFTRVWRIRFSNIHLLALLLADLQTHHADFVISIVDAICENMRSGMEANLFKFNQRRVAMAQYLAELYIYRVINSSIVFDQLWSLLTFGHPNGQPLPGQVCAMDAPDDYFRVRLVCTMLDTCGVCFNKGSLGKRLDEYLAFLNLYILAKEQPLPMDVEFMLTDTFRALRPKFTLLREWASAAKAVDDIIASHRVVKADDTAERKEESSSDEDTDDDDGSSDEEGQDQDEGVAKQSRRTRRREGRDGRGQGLGDEAEVSDEDSSAGSDAAEEEASASASASEATEGDSEIEDGVGRHQQTEEDREAEEQFARELAKMMAEPNAGANSNTSRLAAHQQRGLLDQGIPFIKRAPQLQADTAGGGKDIATDGRMQFELLSKRGNKHQVSLHLTYDEELTCLC